MIRYLKGLCTLLCASLWRSMSHQAALVALGVDMTVASLLRRVGAFMARSYTCYILGAFLFAFPVWLSMQFIDSMLDLCDEARAMFLTPSAWRAVRARL